MSRVAVCGKCKKDLNERPVDNVSAWGAAEHHLALTGHSVLIVAGETRDPIAVVAGADLLSFLDDSPN
jgi:hypothetical protein